MSKQSEALRLAESADACQLTVHDCALVAAELRRLQEVNDELLEALKEATRCLAWHQEQHGVGMDQLAVEQARAAIAKATSTK